MSRDGGGYSINAAADLLGRDRRTVTKAAKKCRPVREDARAKYYDLGDLARALYDKGGGDLDLNAEKAREAHFRANKLARDDAIAAGDAYRGGEVLAALAPVMTEIRSRMLGLRTIAPRLAGQDRVDIEAELDDYGRRILDDLSRFDLGESVRRGRGEHRARRADDADAAAPTDG